jgi:predicted PurR-regulated permease PerM
MDPLIALLIVVLAVLSVLLVIVGVQVVIILKEFRKTLDHMNDTLMHTDDLLTLMANPFQGLGDTVTGIKSGLRVAELFVSWLKENQHEQKRVE